MNSIRWTKGICWMRLASLVKIAVEKCILSTIKVPTEWNTNCQIIKKNNTTTQKKASGWFFPDAFLTQSVCNKMRNILTGGGAERS
jgi:hypothetical protein